MNGHLLRGERRSVERKLGVIKTVLIRKLDYPMLIVALCVLLVIGLHQSQS